MTDVLRERTVLIILKLEPPRVSPLIGGWQWHDDVLMHMVLPKLDPHAADVGSHVAVRPDAAELILGVEEITPHAKIWLDPQEPLTERDDGADQGFGCCNSAP